MTKGMQETDANDTLQRCMNEALSLRSSNLNDSNEGTQAGTLRNKINNNFQMLRK